MTAPTVDLNGAAALMKVHPQTVVDDYISTGELPAAKLGRAYVMMTRDVLAIVEKRIAEQTAKRRGLEGLHQRRAARSEPRKLA